jgi:mono/diheme cytochrome c family protein
LVAGTVPRGDARQQDQGSAEVFTTGKTAGKLVAEVPFPVDRSVLVRGQERYRIFCTPCHSELGDGQGIIVRRGFNPPPSFHKDELRQQPIGQFFDVMTGGHGTMYSYASRIPPRDRWAIAAYIRALQLSQHALATDLTAEDRSQIEGARP